jgi:hypothetical protein
MGRFGLLGAAFLLGVVVVAAASAAGQVTVSPKASVFDTPTCAAVGSAQMAAVPGTVNYLNSEEEPYVAVDPTDGSHLVGVWQQDRWNDGGANGLATGYSTDGGSSWSGAQAFPFSTCFGAGSLPYERASDPWVSIGRGKPGNSCSSTAADCSTVYASGIVFDETDRNSGVATSVSYDGGQTWQHTTAVIQDPCSGVNAPGYTCPNGRSRVLDDKDAITADSTMPGYAYVVWDRLVAPPSAPPGVGGLIAFKGAAFISRTTDYGQTWSAPQQIVSTPAISQTIGNVVVVDPTSGTLYDFFTYRQIVSNKGGNRGETIGFVKSTDHGVSWSPVQTVAPEPTNGVVDANNVDPTTGTAPAPLRTSGSSAPQPAINSTGQLYVTWEGADPVTGTDQVYITTSTDGGASWSAPAVVNSSYTSQPAYTPSIAIGPTGTVGVTYYQWDATTTSGAEPTVLYIQKSTSAGSSSAAPTFGSRTAVSSEFNGLAPPYSETGYFLGDYEGLTVNSSGFIPFNVLTTCDDGGSGVQPSCRALNSVISPTNVAPTDNNATDVYAIPGS